MYRFAADLMFEQKKTDVEVKQILVEQGLREEDAKIVISNLQAQMKEAKSKAADKNMLYGALWCIGGLLVTFLTYSAASGGGHYIVAWGAVVWGGWQFLKGVYQKITL